LVTSRSNSFDMTDKFEIGGHERTARRQDLAFWWLVWRMPLWMQTESAQQPVTGWTVR